VQITGDYQAGQDVLSFADTINIKGTWDAETGTLTLSGSDTTSNYQRALRAVKYRNTSASPDMATRRVTFAVSDGSAESQPATRDIRIVLADSAPKLTGTEQRPLIYTENDPARVVAAAITARNDAGAKLTRAVIQITGNYQKRQDVLSFANTEKIKGKWDAKAGKLTLSGTDTVANYQAALRAVKYQNTSENPSAATRTVTFQVSDGEINSNQVTRSIAVRSVNDAPVLAKIESKPLAYTEKQKANAVSTSIKVSDLDHANLGAATVQITGNYQAGEDVLSFVDMANIKGTWDAQAGKLILRGTSTVATYQRALRAVKYRNTSANPSTATRTVWFTAYDGLIPSNTLTRNITVKPVNDAPVLAGIETTPLSYAKGQTAAVITTTITATDVDNAILASATVQITGGYKKGQDLLAFENTATITGVFDAKTGKLTLIGNATLAEYQAALRAVTYQNTSNTPSTGKRKVTFKVSDGAASSKAVSRTIQWAVAAPAAANDAALAALSWPLARRRA
jgi:hypothetical protein